MTRLGQAQSTDFTIHPFPHIGRPGSDCPGPAWYSVAWADSRGADFGLQPSSFPVASGWDSSLNIGEARRSRNRGDSPAGTGISPVAGSVIRSPLAIQAIRF